MINTSHLYQDVKLRTNLEKTILDRNEVEYHADLLCRRYQTPSRKFKVIEKEVLISVDF